MSRRSTSRISPMTCIFLVAGALVAGVAWNAEIKNLAQSLKDKANL